MKNEALLKQQTGRRVRYLRCDRCDLQVYGDFAPYDPSRTYRCVRCGSRCLLIRFYESAS